MDYLWVIRVLVGARVRRRRAWIGRGMKRLGINDVLLFEAFFYKIILIF